MAGDFPQLDPDFSPAQLNPHLWLDPSDLSTLFQDQAGTTPVTAGGQTAARGNDKSGNGFDYSREAPRQPTYQTSGGIHWIEFDGVDDQWSEINAVPQAQPITRLSAWRQLASADAHLFWGGDRLRISSGSLVLASSAASFTGPAAPASGTDFIVTEICNGASSAIAVDNGDYVTGDLSTGNVGAPRIGADDPSNAPLNGRFYGYLQFDRVLTDPEIALLRTYLAFKQGRTTLARPLRAIDTQGGSGGGPKRQALPYWWHSYIEQWLAELEEREVEYRRIKAVEDAKAAAERYRKALATIAARRAEEQRQAAEAAALRREEDAKLAQRLAAIQREKDERLMQDRARIEAALQRVKDRQEAARLAAEAAELEVLRTTARNRRRRFSDRFEAAIEAARRQGWRAKLN